MTDFEKFTNKVFKAIFEIQPANEEEKIIKFAILVYIYHSLENEEVFNNNCNILNNTRKK